MMTVSADRLLAQFFYCPKICILLTYKSTVGFDLWGIISADERRELSSDEGKCDIIKQ